MLDFNLKKIAIISLVATTMFACNSKKEEQDNMANEATGQDENIVASQDSAGDLDPRKNSTVPDRVFFAYDSAELVREAKAAIDLQAEYIKNKTITIEGHCDERGTAEYNMALGNKRAESVKKELIKSGVNAKNIKTVSYGKSRPAVDGDNEVAHQQNRRAVLVIAN